jgi:hypothetical protein
MDPRMSCLSDVGKHFDSVFETKAFSRPINTISLLESVNRFNEAKSPAETIGPKQLLGTLKNICMAPRKDLLRLFSRSHKLSGVRIPQLPSVPTTPYSMVNNAIRDLPHSNSGLISDVFPMTLVGLEVKSTFDESLAIYKSNGPAFIMSGVSDVGTLDSDFLVKLRDMSPDQEYFMVPAYVVHPTKNPKSLFTRVQCDRPVLSDIVLNDYVGRKIRKRDKLLVIKSIAATTKLHNPNTDVGFVKHKKSRKRDACMAKTARRSKEREITKELVLSRLLKVFMRKRSVIRVFKPEDTISGETKYVDPVDAFAASNSKNLRLTLKDIQEHYLKDSIVDTNPKFPRIPGSMRSLFYIYHSFNVPRDLALEYYSNPDKRIRITHAHCEIAVNSHPYKGILRPSKLPSDPELRHECLRRFTGAKFSKLYGVVPYKRLCLATTSCYPSHTKFFTRLIKKLSNMGPSGSTLLFYPTITTPKLGYKSTVRSYQTFPLNQHPKYLTSKDGKKFMEDLNSIAQDLDTQSDIANILAENVEALSAMPASVETSNAELEALGLFPVDEVLNKRDYKFKKISSSELNKVNKTTATAIRYEEILNAKARPYNPLLPLSNTNLYYVELSDPEQVSCMLDSLATVPVISIDLETSGLNPTRGDKILTWQFTSQPFTAALIRHSLLLAYPELLEKVKLLMTNPNVIKIAQNCAFEMSYILNELGVTMHPYFDTMVAAHFIDENRQVGLKPLAKQELNVDMMEFNEITRGTFKFDMDAKHALEYAASDSDIAWQLYELYAPIIAAGGTQLELKEIPDAKYTRLFNEIDMPTVEVLCSMKMHGIVANAGLIQQMHEECDEDLKALDAKISDFVKDIFPEFRPESDDDLRRLLFGILALPTVSMTAGGKNGDKKQAQVNLESLRALENMSPVIPLLIERSHLAQLKSLYLVPFPRFINPLTCAIETSLLQCGTVTSRLSSNSPNLQNLRKNSED